MMDDEKNETAGVESCKALFEHVEVHKYSNSSDLIKRFLCSLTRSRNFICLNSVLWDLDESNKSHVMNVLTYAINSPSKFSVLIADQYEENIFAFRNEQMPSAIEEAKNFLQIFEPELLANYRK